MYLACRGEFCRLDLGFVPAYYTFLKTVLRSGIGFFVEEVPMSTAAPLGGGYEICPNDAVV